MNTTSSGITQPVRTFVQPPVKSLQTFARFYQEQNGQLHCQLAKSLDSLSPRTTSSHYGRPQQPALVRVTQGIVLTIEQLAQSWNSVQVKLWPCLVY